jgi:uncharacterized membrane protein
MQMLILASFIGFVVENLFKLFKSGYVDNRFMFLPFLFGYGFFVIAIGILIGTPQNMFPLAKRRPNLRRPWNYFVYFIIISVLVSVGELALGFAVEKIGGFHYWDYSNLPLNFTRYTSLPTSLGFGFIITLFMGFVYTPAMRFFEGKMSCRKWRIATVIVFALLAADLIASFAVMIYRKARIPLWRIHVFKK